VLGERGERGEGGGGVFNKWQGGEFANNTNLICDFFTCNGSE